MCALRDLGANTPIGRAYTEKEILAKVLKGKQRGYIAGRGRVVPGIGKTRLPMPLASDSYTTPEIDKMFAEKEKKIKEVEGESKETKRQLKEVMKVMKTNLELWSQLMSQMESQTEAGSGSGTGVGATGSRSVSGSGSESGSGSDEAGLGSGDEDSDCDDDEGQ